jgi:hypothetical protein
MKALRPRTPAERGFLVEVLEALRAVQRREYVEMGMSCEELHVHVTMRHIKTPRPQSRARKRSRVMPRKRKRPAGRLSPKPAQPGTCRECECTDDAACMTEFGPCSWVDTTHTLCSGCAP